MRRSILSPLLALSSLLAPSLARADWSSGGGIIVKDSQNPWFVQNTPTVRYCIARDAQTFSVGEDKLDQIVTMALTYWKGEFARSDQGSEIHPVQVKVATQQFIKTECGADTQLRFQFGFLTDAQKQQITRPKEIVGIAVRTDYDVPTLSGKGFVYIAADSGPLKPDVVNSFGHDTPDGFWSLRENSSLLRAVAHELGHIFGVPHRGGEWELMGDGHLEHLLAFETWTPNANDALTLAALPAIFNDRYKTDYLYCNPAIDSLFGTPTGMKCMRLRGNVEDGLTWTVSADENAPEQTFAVVSYEGFSSANWDEAVKLYVPRDHPLMAGHSGYLSAVSRRYPYEISGRIKYADPTRAEEPVLLHLYPGSFAIYGAKFGTIQPTITGKYNERTFLFWNHN